MGGNDSVCGHCHPHDHLAYHGTFYDSGHLSAFYQIVFDGIAIRDHAPNRPHIDTYATTFATSTRSLLLHATTFQTDRVKETRYGGGHALTRIVQVNVPKTRRTYCKGKDCKKHTQHKVTR